MGQNIPQPGQLYQHFKGMLYQIITVAKHSETGEELVIYQALYGDFKTYARPLSMFLSEVDHEKYPNVSQQYRFTPISREELGNDARQNKDTGETSKALAMDNQKQDVTAQHLKDSDNLNLAVKEEQTKTEEGLKKDELHPEANLDLMAFLDANDCAEKLEILYSMKNRIDERTMGNIEIALDLPVSEESIEERIDIVKNKLQVMAKYENRRLR
ncbi:DUF1653 domain-containing protein [Lachnoclostridium sp.]|uniref:DUF1653 domain-containing protein n=2 Tax=Lachnoclostridium sp. TaxID=2028282 RepID=UPI0026956A60|nr:DUF1653 domain-containing protein [Lachnoclostridium sp.]